METINCIKTRRSRREFLDKQVSKGDLNKILECGIHAPSSKNCQPWIFIIADDDKLKKELSKLKDEENRNHILTAPLSIIVCINKEKSPSKWIEDGVTAAENILLAAHDLGLGAVYVGGFSSSDKESNKKISELLDLPENLIAVTIIPLGYPNPKEKLEKKDLIKLNEIVYYNKWGN